MKNCVALRVKIIFEQYLAGHSHNIVVIRIRRIRINSLDPYPDPYQKLGRIRIWIKQKLVKTENESQLSTEILFSTV